MPVTTRSMMKHGPQPSSGSVGFLACPPCCTEGNTTSTSDSPSPHVTILENLPSLPDLVGQGDSSSSSSESSSLSLESGHSSATALDEFQIFEFQNFQISTDPLHSSRQCHNFDSIQPRVESDCVDNTNSSSNMRGVMLVRINSFICLH